MKYRIVQQKGKIFIQKLVKYNELHSFWEPVKNNSMRIVYFNDAIEAEKYLNGNHYSPELRIIKEIEI